MSASGHREPRFPGVFRLSCFAARLPAVVVCALAAHAAVYGSVAPADPEHTYFAWYAPTVTAVSALSLVMLPLGLAALLSGRRPDRVARLTHVLLAGRSRTQAVPRRAAELAAGSISFLVAQETLERSLALHSFSLPAFGVSTWLVLLAAAALAAALVALVGRVVDVMVGELLTRTRSRSPKTATARPSLLTVPRPRPLAIHGALRAPPALT